MTLDQIPKKDWPEPKRKWAKRVARLIKEVEAGVKDENIEI